MCSSSLQRKEIGEYLVEIHIDRDSNDKYISKPISTSDGVCFIKTDNPLSIPLIGAQ